MSALPLLEVPQINFLNHPLSYACPETVQWEKEFLSAVHLIGI